MSRPRPALPRLTLLLATTLICTGPGCTDVGSRDWFVQPSAVPFTVVDADPADGTAEVARDAPVDVYLSDLPDPDSLSLATFVLRSGTTQFTGGFKVDLLDRRVRYFPARTLPPHLEMRVFVGKQLRALDGRELGTDLEWGFLTGDGVGGEPTQPPPVVLADLAPLFATRCAAGCHEGPGAFHGLDLSSADASYDGLVGRDSVERPALFRVAGGDHARSYLMRKLLGAPGIVGDPMPPPDRAPLDADEQRKVADWIDEGAPR